MQVEPPVGDRDRVDAGSLAVASGDGHARITLRGQIDLSMTSTLRATVRSVLVEGFTDLDINLAEVSFLDSSALGALVNAHRQVKLFRGTLRLESPSEPVLRLLGLTALDRVFTVSHPGQA